MRRANLLVRTTASTLVLCSCLVPNPTFVDTDETGSEACAVDDFEPNSSELDAFALGDVRSDAPLVSLAARLEAASDQDWYVFDGLDVDDQVPLPEVSVIAEGVTLSICAFVECEAGVAATEVTCADGADHAHTQESIRPGCCADGRTSAAFTCSAGADSSATVFVRVALASELSECSPYVLQYAF